MYNLILYVNLIVEIRMKRNPVKNGRGRVKAQSRLLSLLFRSRDIRKCSADNAKHYQPADKQNTEAPKVSQNNFCSISMLTLKI